MWERRSRSATLATRELNETGDRRTRGQLSTSGGSRRAPQRRHEATSGGKRIETASRVKRMENRRACGPQKRSEGFFIDIGGAASLSSPSFWSGSEEVSTCRIVSVKVS